MPVNGSNGRSGKHGGIEPLAVSPHDASTMLGVCLATIYNRMASGELPSTQLGRRRLIPIAAIRKIIESAS